MAFHKFQINFNLIALIGISSRLCSVCCIPLGSDCGQHILVDGYPRALCNGAGTICDQHTAKCRCQDDYPIPHADSESCLEYRQLGDLCLIDQQCNRTEFSFCQKFMSLPNDPTKFKDLIQQFYRGISAGEKEFGLCQCKQGYIQAGKMCYQGFIDVNCSTSFDCTKADLFSHCNKTTKQCICDTGYVYDPDLHQCKMIFKMFGQVCQFDNECQESDPMLDCRYKTHIGFLGFGYCYCRKGFKFDPSVDRCQPSNIVSQPNIQLCPQGFIFDEQSDDCQKNYHMLYESDRFGANGPTKGRILISNNKLLETVVILFLCCIMIVFLGFWRYILPNNTVPESQNRVPDFSHVNRVQTQTSGSNLLNRGPVIQLRLNLETPDAQTLPNNLSVAVPLTDCASNSESAHHFHGEDPPTYEEAMAYFKTNK